MTEEKPAGRCRHFVSYSGTSLPFRLVNELGEAELSNRNTFFRAYFDGQGRVIALEKVVYGEIEFEHRYDYHDNGRLRRAQITDAEEEVRVVSFDERGEPA